MPAQECDDRITEKSSDDFFVCEFWGKNEGFLAVKNQIGTEWRARIKFMQFRYTHMKNQK